MCEVYAQCMYTTKMCVQQTSVCTGKCPPSSNKEKQEPPTTLSFPLNTRVDLYSIRRATKKKTHSSPYTSLVADHWPTFLLCAFQCVCQTSRRALEVDCPETQPYWGSSLNFRHATQIVNIYSFVVLLLLIFSRFLTVDRLVQLLAFVIHGLPY